MDIFIIFAAKYLYLLVILLAIIFWLFAAKTQKRNLLKLSLISFPISYLVSKILGLFIYDNRPFVIENVKPLISHAANNGFPSDHTLLTLTIASVLYHYNRKLSVFLFLMGLVVGFARVIAKIHYPLDILGSFVIAISATYIAGLILKKQKTIDSFANQIFSKIVR